MVVKWTQSQLEWRLFTPSPTCNCTASAIKVSERQALLPLTPSPFTLQGSKKYSRGTKEEVRGDFLIDGKFIHSTKTFISRSL